MSESAIEFNLLTTRGRNEINENTSTFTTKTTVIVCNEEFARNLRSPVRKRFEEFKIVFRVVHYVFTFRNTTNIFDKILQ